MRAVGKFFQLLFVLGLSLAVSRPGMAVVVSTTTETTSRPEDDFGWDNVGVLDGSTATYLGNRWVLGAKHVGVGAVEFPQIGLFEADLSTVFQLQDPPGSSLTREPDLIMFQLIEDPGLPPLDIVRETPSVGTEVWVAGHGLDAGPDFTYWDVTQRGVNWTWKETSAPGEYSGLKTVGPSVLRWGTNLIEDEESFKNEFDDDILTRLIGPAGTQTWTILTEFDSDDSNSDDDVLTPDGSTATRYESQGVLADSGGGMFVRNGDNWQLAGVILSVEGHRNQPDVTRTAIFGNLTYYADLATYEDQIRSRAVFGDFGDDQALTVDDVDALMLAMREAPSDRRFDLNGDEVVSAMDLDIWVTDVFGTLAGDANLSGAFDTADIVLVLQGGGFEDGIDGNATWSSGDWDGDGDFGTSDLIMALQAGGFGGGPPSAAARVSVVYHVPEPSTGLLLLLGLIGVLNVGRRSGHR